MGKSYLYIIIFYLISCKGDNLVEPKFENQKNVFNDSIFVVNNEFNKGDIRRYGIYPNKPIDNTYLKNVLKVATNGIEIYFPEGIYDLNLDIKGLSNINMHFNKSIITGKLYIINKDSIPSKNIKMNGDLTVLDKIFIRKSNNIYFENLLVTSDTSLNINHKKNRGVSIYAGSNNISFNNLIIENTGGDNTDYFKHSAAALQIHGWNNNPNKVIVNYLNIKNAARTALYLTGTNHEFKKVEIKNFGLGKSTNMFGLDDANPTEEKDFSGAWINKCNNCVIDTLEIFNPLQKGRYSLHLDYGKPHQPTFINHIKIDSFASKLHIKSDKLTNILVKDEY